MCVSLISIVSLLNKYNIKIENKTINIAKTFTPLRIIIKTPIKNKIHILISIGVIGLE
jgi:hypothetical protein